MSKLNEGYEDLENYMFFSNLESIKRMIEKIQSLDFHKIDVQLSNGHDWATDHVGKAKENVQQVCDFLCSNREPKDVVTEPRSGNSPIATKPAGEIANAPTEESATPVNLSAGKAPFKIKSFDEFHSQG